MVVKVYQRFGSYNPLRALWDVACRAGVGLLARQTLSHKVVSGDIGRTRVSSVGQQGGMHRALAARV